MWKPDAYIEDCPCVVIASWHLGDSVDFYGPSANESSYAQCVYDIVMDYLTELVETDIGDFDETDKGMMQDFISNRDKYSKSMKYINTALNLWGNPDILQIKVLYTNDGMKDVWSWGY